MKAYHELKQVKADLEELCVKIGERYLGTHSNKEAVKYVAGRLVGAGCLVVQPSFRCINWQHGNIDISINDETLKAFISPYSPPCDISGDFETASSLEEIGDKSFENKIMVIHGDACEEQLVLKNSFSGDSSGYRGFRQLIMKKKPLAVITVMRRQHGKGGKSFLTPLLGDGDFSIPCAYLGEEEGEKIIAGKGSKIYLRIESYGVPSIASNVIGIRHGKSKKKVIFFAHIDTKEGTPGALDNGGGVSVLLTLADLLEDYEGEYTIELAALNGEDYHSNLGEMLYIAQNEGNFSDIVLAVNVDGVGCAGAGTGYCCFCKKDYIRETVEYVLGKSRGFVEMDPWYQNSNMMFVDNNIPLTVITSENYEDICSQIAHTSRDTIDKLDCSKIYYSALALRELIEQLEKIKGE